MNEEKLYDKKAAADYLKISVPGLENLMRNKKISFSKIGDPVQGRVVFMHSDLKAVLLQSKKFTIRDSSKEILRSIPPGAKPKMDQLGKFSDLGEFFPVMQLCNDILEKWQRELDAKNWYEPALFEKMKILFKNIEAVRDLCTFALPDVGVALCERLAGREISLWDSEITPNLKLAKKYLAPGKLHAVEIIARPAHTMPNHVALRSIHVGDDGWPLSESEWRPVPTPSEAEASNFFNYRLAADIRISLRTKKPVSFRDQQAQTQAADEERAAAVIALESDSICPEE